MISLDFRLTAGERFRACDSESLRTLCVSTGVHIAAGQYRFRYVLGGSGWVTAALGPTLTVQRSGK